MSIQESVREALPASPLSVEHVAQTSAKPCALCSSSSVSLRFAKFGYSIVQCDTCRLVYLDHLVSPDDLRDFYSSEYFNGAENRRGYADYIGDEVTARRSFRTKLDKIERVKAPGSILDIGCAAGFFLQEAAARGWEVYGHEVSEYAGAIARERIGDRVYIGTLDAVDLPERSMDVITMWDVVEHLDDPLDALRRVRRWLKDDGMLVMCTGNIDSWLARLQGHRSRIYNPPQHLYYFSETTLTALLKKAGFRVVRRENDWKTLSLDYFFHIVACLHPGSSTRLLHRVVTSSSLGRRAIHIPLVDNLKVYGVSDPYA